MPRVICKLPNASDEISGVKFHPLDSGAGKISDEIDQNLAELFASIPGYELDEVGEQTPPPPPAPAPTLTKKEKEALAKKAKEEEAARQAAEAQRLADEEAAQKAADEKKAEQERLAAEEAAKKAAEGGNGSGSDGEVF